MAGIDDIVTVNISGTAPALTLASFNTTMCVTAHGHSPSLRVLTYGSTSDMLSDGWLTTEAGYLMAAAEFAQTPCPAQVKIGRRANAYTHTMTLAVTDATAGAKYALTVGGVAVTYLVPSTGSPTTTTVAAALVAALGTISGYTITSSGPTITVARSTAGVLVHLQGWTRNLTVTDTTADPGLAADLAAILAEDDQFYGLVLDTQSKAEILALAAFAETNKKFATPTTSDSAAKDPTATTDVLSALQTSSYTRTGCLFSGSDNQAFGGAAWQGYVFPDDPGTETWAFKTLAGVPADNLTPTERNAIEAKNGTAYSARKGVAVTQFGKTAAGGWLDTTRGIDWLKEDIQSRVYLLLLTNKKVPYSDRGISLIKSQVLAALEDAVQREFILPGYTVTAPTAASANPTDKANRALKNVTFTATLAGAIHTTVINGTVS